ncbi:PREDICTED: zinc finger protein 2 homolog [Cyprinodon variegatus]|nr:PREDICTED: zinc finger protein 2 homolog [Cyprinodon variegatus]
MEKPCQIENSDVFLPLSSLRLLIPPLRLLSAAMWQVAQRRDVLGYGVLCDFVTLVTDTVPDLLDAKQRGKLLLRLRAKVILELCRNLERIRPQGSSGSGDAEVDAEEAIFVELIQTLLNDPAEREHFYQEVFPAEFDLSYDADMQLLAWEFLSKLERLLAVPDLGQAASWLTSGPSILKDCMQTLSNPDDLRVLLQHHRSLQALSIPGSTVEISTQVFACSVCPFSHMQEAYLLQHMERSHPEQKDKLHSAAKKPPPPKFPQPFPIHDRPDPHTCPDCGKTFTRTSDVTRHRRTHTGERPYACEECTKAFKNSWDLVRHQRIHTGERPFLCSQCGKRFTQMGLLKLHFERTACSQMCSPPLDLTTEVVVADETVDKEGGEYKCQICGEMFGSILKRMKHRQRHVVRRQYRCPHCEKTYTRASDLKRHQMKHEGARPFACECGKSFTHMWLLNKHRRIHGRERPFLCGECGETFTDLQILKRHRLTHGGRRPFRCSACEKTFTQLASLIRHERNHTGERPFLCTTCEKTFLTNGELARHQRSHSSLRPFSCHQCQKSFKSKRAQIKHLHSHTGERPFSCLRCGKRFSKSNSLLRHNLIHTGERPHRCQHCSKAFITSGELLLHQRTHTGERPYSCSHCEKRFRCSSDLNMHVRTHTGDKPHRCLVCERRFSTPSKLKKHMQTHAEKSADVQSLSP